MDGTNLFDHGRSSQSSIIKPYLHSIKLRLKDNSLDSGSRSFFIKELRSCIAMLSEHENRPKWVKDIETYRMKSEIAAFIALFAALELSEDDSSADKQDVKSLYNEVQDFGKDRGWDLQILHVQFIRAMGNNIQNYIIQIVTPHTLKPIDYN